MGEEKEEMLSTLIKVQMRRLGLLELVNRSLSDLTTRMRTMSRIKILHQRVADHASKDRESLSMNLVPKALDQAPT